MTSGNSVSRRVGRLPACAILRRFVRQQDGTTAIEFALVAAPFFALLFAIIETALVFFAGQVLETGTADAARLIMTGQAQQQAFSQAQFKDALCQRISGLFNCGGLHVDVRKYTNFASIPSGKPLDENGNLNQDFTYQPGCPGEIVVVRAVYEWPVFVSLLGLDLSDMSGNKRLLMSTTAFRNEPYPANGPC